MGDHTEHTEDHDLVLVGSNLAYGWFDPTEQSQQVREITIQFHWNLFVTNFLKRNKLSFIRTLLERSAKEIVFSQDTAARIRPRLEAIGQKSGFDSVLELMSILHDLSTSRDMRMLSNTGFSGEQINYNSRRIENAFGFMHENFDRVITLSDVAKIVNINEVAFSRFIKKHIGKTFIESFNEIRLGQASRLLIETTLPSPRCRTAMSSIIYRISTEFFGTRTAARPASSRKITRGHGCLSERRGEVK